MSDAILVDKSGGVATVTLDIPATHNAFDDQVIDALSHAFNNIDQDDSIRVMVLAAKGKNFSAGANLNWMKSVATYSYEENLKDARALANMLRTLDELSKPTIAKVQGATYGGGVGLLSCCDIVVASDASKFCLSEVKIGLIPATISPYVIAAIGARAARRYFLSAEAFDAEQALRLGLVSEICVHDELANTVSTLVRIVLENSPAAVKQSKKLISDVNHRVIDDALIEDTCERIAAVRVSAEGQEGLSAFLTKRRPSWSSLKE